LNRYRFRSAWIGTDLGSSKKPCVLYSTLTYPYYWHQ